MDAHPKKKETTNLSDVIEESMSCYCPSKLTDVTSDTIIKEIKINRSDSSFFQVSLSGEIDLPRLGEIFEIDGEGKLSKEIKFWTRVDSIVKIKNQPIEQKCLIVLDKLAERCCQQYMIWREDSLPRKLRNAAFAKYIEIEENYYHTLKAC